MNRLSKETNDLLQVATIIGREFSYDALVAMGDRTEEQLLKLIEEAIDARVIEELDRPGRYRFSHAQIQETLLAELSTTRRVRLHGQVGEALEKLWGARAEERAAQLALHFVEAATLAPRFLDKAVRYSGLAGRRAAAQSAFADAARHFQAAVAALEGGELDAALAGLLVELGQAQRATFDVSAAWRNLSLAVEYYAKAGDPTGVAETPVLFGKPEFLTASQVPMLERALTLVPAGGPEEFDVLVSLGYATGMRGDLERANGTLAAARAILGRHPKADAELRLLRARGSIETFFVQVEAALATCSRLVELATSLDRDEEAFAAHHLLFVLRSHLGEFNLAAKHSDSARMLAEKYRFGFRIAAATGMGAAISLFRGEWEEVERYVTRGLEAASADARLLGFKAMVELETGRFGAADATTARLYELTVPARLASTRDSRSEWAPWPRRMDSS